MTDIAWIVANDISRKAVSALPIRFQKMIRWATLTLSHHCDDQIVLLDVFSDRVYFAYPTKSGPNGALLLYDEMNNRYTYNYDAKDYPVLRIRLIGGQKVLELRFCNDTINLPRSYLKDRNTALELLEET